ncbi:MAG: ureidoglycolate lyase [Clostridia bacterium]|nr:ureidoglycolate lyase [Clostridia bacterium]
MRTVKVEALTKEAFAAFGQYYTMSSPEGYPLSGELHRFFPDRLVASQGRNVAYSPILVKKPDVMHVTQVEYHTTTAEMILPLNDDMILHVAPPSAGKPLPEYTRAFLVPKNTLVKMNACVWHLAPLPANADELCAMIVLPECTYMNDCTVVDLKADEQFVIEK